MSDLANPWTAAYQVPPSMGFSRQEYWSGVLLPSLGEQYRGSIKKKKKKLKIELAYDPARKFVHKDGGVKGCVLIFSCENSKIATGSCTTINKLLDPQKKISHVQWQRTIPNKMEGGAKMCLETNPIPARDAWRAQKKKKKKPCVHEDPETPHPTRD